MAHFLRGKQAGIQKDFSGSLAPELFDIDDVCLARSGTSFSFLPLLTFRM
jgi:syntaxin-binding protein 5